MQGVMVEADLSLSLWDWWGRDSWRRGRKIGVKSLDAEQATVICFLAI